MRYVLLIALGFMSSGCMLELLGSTAIQGELAANNAQQGQKVIHQAKDSKGKTELDQAIKMYSFEEEQYPATLDDLVPGYLPVVPMRGNGASFHYNPQTGEVSLKAMSSHSSVPAVMTLVDEQNLDVISNAIYDYWQATGGYPDSLDSLVPLYIDAIPANSSGGRYIYDSSTGAVNHPAELRPAAPAQNGSPHPKPKMIQENYSDSQLDALVELGL